MPQSKNEGGGGEMNPLCAFSPFFILSLCLKQSPVLTGVCHAFLHSFYFFF